ncbi:cellulase family glycosylhydrolase [Caldicellulosiruptoraceae bacterium PP1]
MKRKIILRIVSILIIISLALSFIFINAASKNSKVNTFVYITPVQASKEMEPGWNLGNTLDAIPTETSWGNPETQAYMFDDIKKAGFKSVRIPITWADHIGSAPEYTIDKTWLDRVEQIVDWALERDLYVIINAHHDSWRWLSSLKNDKEGNMKKLEKIWQQVAQRFKNKSAKLMFEVINEPYYDGYSEQEQGAIQNELNNRILKTIRSTGGNNQKRIVVIPALSCDSYKMAKYFEVPKDENIILTFHYYSPWNFTANWWGKTTWGNEEDLKNMEKDLKTVYDKFKGKYPIVIGEYGLFNGNKPAEWFYFDTFLKLAHKYGMQTMYWDNGGNYDRKNRVWRDEQTIKIIANSAKNINNSFVDPGILYFEDGKTIKDTTLSFKLNGNKLVNIMNNKYVLKKDKDYVANGSKIILKASYIKTLLNNDEYGVNATLRFKFNKGADYPLDIVKYNKPKVLDEEIYVSKDGNNNDTRIITAFNGTKLTAVKLVSENGQNIRDSWTPYLRGWDDFAVDNGSITIKKHVLDMIKSDAVLTFEFFPEGVSLQVKVKAE